MLYLFNVLFIFISIDLFGLFDFGADLAFGSLNTLDIFLGLCNLFFLRLLITKVDFRRLVFTSSLRFLFYLYLFTIFIFCTMPFRGDIGIIDAIKTGRSFLTIPILFLISYDILLNQNQKKYQKLTLFIALFTSLQIIIAAFNPQLISLLFKYTRARENMKFDYQRNDFLSNSMLFPHLAAATLSIELIVKRKITKRNILMFTIFFLGMALQGFRSYFVSMVVMIIIILFITVKFTKIFKYVMILLLLVPLLNFVDKLYFNEQIFSKFHTINDDFEQDSGSTLKSRENRNEIYILPKYLEKPYFGWGFVHHSSKYGKSIGLSSKESGLQKTYTLYSIDSGYLSLLNMFGAVGCLLILTFIIRTVRHLFKDYKAQSTDPLIAISFLIMLTVTLYTHGGFYSIFGILPLALILGISNTQNLNYEK